MGTKGDKQTSKGAGLAVELLLRLEPLHEITSKKMFGGHGFFQRGKMFGLVSPAAEFFLKVDDSNKARFTQAGSAQHGKMPYFQVPQAVLTDDAKLLEWARTAVAVAHHG
ncbi:MAG: TfoX/Sxy family protein [Acidobacteria bacterium]|nr:TfoX/Sxy family protein [Acidobacteriota bacterium]MDA1233871.1 TfoX/Sxy family protein [Acidobacteriota bacterium]